MSGEDEPIPPDLDDLVSGMRRDRLGEAQLGELRRRLAPMLTGGGGSGSPPAHGPTLWIAGAGVVVIAVVSGWWALSGERHVTSRVAGPEPVSTTVEVRPEPEASEPSAHEPSAHEVQAPEAPLPAVSPTLEVEAAVDDRPRERHRTGRALEVGDEHTILVEARHVLPLDPARALSLADEHRARFADGVLAPEREMIAIDALEALGRREQAATRAAALVARWPTSAYARRVRARGLAP